MIDERTPEAPPTRKGLLRKQLHERIAEAGSAEGLRWTAVRASDQARAFCYGADSPGSESSGLAKKP